jgi:hypothetical protein
MMEAPYMVTAYSLHCRNLSPSTVVGLLELELRIRHVCEFYVVVKQLDHVKQT